MAARGRAGPRAAKAGSLSAKDALAAARDLAAICGIFLFFTGFVYRQYYLNELAGPISARGAVAFDEAAIYAYTVFREHAGWFVALVAAQLFAVAAGILYPAFVPRLAPWRYPMLGFAVLGIFLVCDRWAHESAHADVEMLRRGQGEFALYNLKFKAKAHAKYPQQLVDAGEGDGVRVVGGTDKKLLVLDQNIPAAPCTPLDIGLLYAVDTADLDYTRIILREIPYASSRPTPTPVPTPTPKPCP